MRGWAALTMLALTCGVPGSAAAPATAAVPTLGFYDLDRGAGGTDGERYFVYSRSPGTLLIVDTRTGRRTSFRSPCSLIQAAHAHAVALGCDPADQRRFAVVDLAARRVTFLPRRPLGRETNYGSIGRYWVGASSCDAGHCGQVYLNWRTGRTAFFTSDAPPDLDSPSLAPFYPYDHDVLRFAASGRGLYVLPRHERAVLLSRCRVSCDRPTVSGRRVTWREGRILHGYVIPTRGRCSWRIPAPPGTDLRFGIDPEHTVERVYAVAAARDRSQLARIYSSRWTC